MEISFHEEIQRLRLGDGETFSSDVTCLRQVSLH